MSIQGAMLNALSSLAAEQRAAALISNNVANAQTPGYVRRDLPRSENLVAGTGAGVATGVTQRAGDSVLAAASRGADGVEAFADRMQSLLETYTSTIGQPADERSLSSLLGTLKDALTTLSAAPNNAVAQSQALSAAQDLVDGFHDMDDAVSNIRTQADLGVAQDVKSVNTALDSLKEVEQKLAQASARGASTAEYEDQRDSILSGLSQKLPLRIYDNGPGKLLVMTDGGTTLFDSGTAHKLSFTHARRRACLPGMARPASMPPSPLSAWPAPSASMQRWTPMPAVPSGACGMVCRRRRRAMPPTTPASCPG
jgi:flagellar hook-associated protein 1 FlgK